MGRRVSHCSVLRYEKMSIYPQTHSTKLDAPENSAVESRATSCDDDEL
jgi:hypothetical protein